MCYFLQVPCLALLSSAHPHYRLQFLAAAAYLLAQAVIQHHLNHGCFWQPLLLATPTFFEQLEQRATCRDLVGSVVRSVTTSCRCCCCHRCHCRRYHMPCPQASRHCSSVGHPLPCSVPETATASSPGLPKVFERDLASPDRST